MLFHSFVWGLFGLIFGSFYQVISQRLPAGESIVWGRSRCPSCQVPLRPLDLVPLVSYFLFAGKCRYCGWKIPLQYPLVEISTALLFMAAYVHAGYSAAGLSALILLSLAILVTLTDVQYLRIPNKLLLFFLVVFLCIRLFFLPFDPWWDPFFAAFLALALLYAVMRVSRGGLGGGDVKLFAVLGLAFGMVDLTLVFFLSTLIGTIGAGIGMVFRKVRMGKPFPFAPSIALAAMITLFWGEVLWSFYHDWMIAVSVVQLLSF